MDTQLQFRVNAWILADPDLGAKQELQTLLDNQDEVELAKRFSGRLAFGTAGLRGVVGAGPMRMNRFVVQQTTSGLGAYLKSQGDDLGARGVVIGYDGRHDSKQFAHDAANVLTAMGIKVYLTDNVCATPLIAFGVLHFGASAGIVVTASHNPPQYNGYKVYWGNGAQIISPHDSGIAACVYKAADESIRQPTELMDPQKTKSLGILIMLKDDFYHTYRQGINHARVLQNHTRPELVSLAYTAMHGVGADMAETVLKDAGVNDIYIVAAQREPDGDFPTVNFPNPEEEGAMDLVITEAKKYQAMLACANDPDADRFAVAVRMPNTGEEVSVEYQMLTGDQVGVLLGHYLLTHSPKDQRLTCTTIVSSSLLSKIAASFDATCMTTLTGFKWLTNVAMAEQTQDNRFLFAYEEALGYTVGDMVWDKDGLSALVAFAQLTAELASNGLMIWDRLNAIYAEHGFHLNAQVSIASNPTSPNPNAYLRQYPPVTIADRAIVSWDDIDSGERHFADGRVEIIDLPRSDVLIYRLDGEARVIVRPSGTEPKIKCYYEIVETMRSDDTLASVQLRAQIKMTEFIQAHQASLSQSV